MQGWGRPASRGQRAAPRLPGSEPSLQAPPRTPFPPPGRQLWRVTCVAPAQVGAQGKTDRPGPARPWLVEPRGEPAWGAVRARPPLEGRGLWSPSSRRLGAARCRGRHDAPTKPLAGLPEGTGRVAPLLAPTPGSQRTEPPKVLTAMGKMVQQIATINNLLIFINIQISQLQKPREGRASGEGRAGRRRITPCTAWAPGSCQGRVRGWAPASPLPAGDRGAGLGTRPPLCPPGTRLWGWLNAPTSWPGQGPAFPAPGSRGSGSDLRVQPVGAGPRPGGLRRE